MIGLSFKWRYARLMQTLPSSIGDDIDIESDGLMTSNHITTQHNSTQHNTTQHNSTQHNTTQHNTTQLNTTQHNTTQHNTTQHNTTQHNTTQHNRLTSACRASFIICFSLCLNRSSVFFKSSTPRCS